LYSDIKYGAAVSVINGVDKMALKPAAKLKLDQTENRWLTIYV